MNEIRLAKPDIADGERLYQLLFERYSCREFLNKSIALEKVGQLLWSADGKSKYKRTAPSAGATYPLELYLMVGVEGIKGISAGLYYYHLMKHALISHISDKDLRRELAYAALNQEFIYDAPLTIIISANYGKTLSYYGKRGERYVHMEVGCVCQNIHLTALSLGLGTVIVAAFNDNKVRNILKIESHPLAIMPIGYPREQTASL